MFGGCVDVEWAVGELEKCREILEEMRELVPLYSDPFQYVVNDKPMIRLKHEFIRSDVTVKRIAAQLGMHERWARANSVRRHLEVLTEMEETVARAGEMRDRLGPRGPQLAATGLHHWVWDAAASFWDQKAYDVAVREAARALDLHLQTKLNRRDESGVSLVQQAFSLNEPNPGQPRLRFQGDFNKETWENLHRGAMRLGEACFLALRNPSIHEDLDLAPDHALEQLATLSLLARWIDEAEIIEHESE